MLRAIRQTDHRPALRVGIGLAVPGAVLLAAGRPELLVYAVFGSFVGMFGRGQPPGARLRQQAIATVRLGVAVVVGLVLAWYDADPRAIALCTVLYAAAASWAAERVGLRPAVPFFGVLGLGSLAALPQSQVDLLLALAIYGATAALSLGIGQLTRLGILGTRRVVPGPGSAPPVEAAEARWRALGYGVSVALASAAALGFGVGHVGWAAAAATVPLAAATLRGRVGRGIECFVGTVAGLVIAALLLLPAFPLTVKALLVIVLLVPTESFMAKNYGLALGFFTPLILLMTDLSAPATPLQLVSDRLIGTGLGVVAGIAVAALLHPYEGRGGRRG
ncbi:FUSC family protein [Zhihengliuella sp.]|uniref:FUSC family protein n=1 Tax=Zhihengliuella sp. TaxID=1954483 RepID=UPI002811C12B|nr:FUSC family protein [Zhihengliuella sp.]